jgi:prolyl-tRNA synthetase
MLPLGQRVQDKLERLIDRHMAPLGASKLSLSSISSQALWEQTDRLQGYGPELFRFEDRKQVPYLLAPTHEEEITTLVSKTITSYKSLPLRLYQIGRKYRDEIRPRHGILRSKEFVMKDLYTFDYSVKSALATYEEVRRAYSALFNQLKLPYLVAEASSGDIGGDLSHEYHLPTSIGEDDVISCNSCNYVANGELAVARYHAIGPDSQQPKAPGSVGVWRAVSKDRSTLINVWYPEHIEAPHASSPAFISHADLNLHAIKVVVPDLDSSLEDSSAFWSMSPSRGAMQPTRLVNIVDFRLGQHFITAIQSGISQVSLLPQHSDLDLASITQTYVTSLADGAQLNALSIRDGDGCPRCAHGYLRVQKAIELGHTFHLGTRYSDPLAARVQVPAALIEDDSEAVQRGSQPETRGTVSTAMHMGCHGIGVSRIIGAVADHLADEKGLNWPRAIAPFEVVVVPAKGSDSDAAAVAAHLADRRHAAEDALDIALDDRPHSFAWKMRDADLVGYPIIVILGRKWPLDRICEVQCRRLGVMSNVSFDDLQTHISQVLARL